MFPGQRRVRRKRTAVLLSPGPPPLASPPGRPAGLSRRAGRQAIPSGGTSGVPSSGRAGHQVPSRTAGCGPLAGCGALAGCARSHLPEFCGPGRRVAGPRICSRGCPDTQTHRWPLDGQSAPPGQRCDPADPAAVAKSGADPRRHRCSSSHSPQCCPRRQPPLAPRKGDEPPEHAKTSELRYVRTSARLRTPRRCWRECARAH
jgi:hypothetical protein